MCMHPRPDTANTYACFPWTCSVWVTVQCFGVVDSLWALLTYVAYSCLDISLVMKVRYREAESLGALWGRVYILVIGKMEPFHPDNGSIAVYLGCMGLYLSANSTPETKQVLFFLNLIGRGTYKLLSNLLAPDKPAEMSLVGFYETLRTLNPRRWW